MYKFHICRSARQLILLTFCSMGWWVLQFVLVNSGFSLDFSLFYMSYLGNALITEMYRASNLSLRISPSGGSM